MYLDHLISKAEEVVQSPAMRDRIRLCSNLRISCEGWLKIELLNAFSSIPDIRLLPEDGNVDIVAQWSDGSRVLIELKTFPTNYGAKGKPITQFRDGVVKDLVKLTKKRGEHPHALVIMIVYPIPRDKEKAWEDGMAEINAAGSDGKRLRDLRVTIDQNVSAHIYFISAR